MKTCDLCDANEDAVRICDPGFKDFGGLIEFEGPAWPIKAFEDNSLVREALATDGEGRVLVVDSGASMRYAMLGGNLAVLAADNGWAGVVINGCVRDTAELAEAKVGIKALGIHPRKTPKNRQGQVGVSVIIGSVTIDPGNWVYADEDGLIVSDYPL